MRKKPSQESPLTPGGAALNNVLMQLTRFGQVASQQQHCIIAAVDSSGNKELDDATFLDS